MTKRPPPLSSRSLAKYLPHCGKLTMTKTDDVERLKFIRGKCRLDAEWKEKRGHPTSGPFGERELEAAVARILDRLEAAEQALKRADELRRFAIDIDRDDPDVQGLKDLSAAYLAARRGDTDNGD